MSTPENLANFNPTVHALPPVPQAVGELISELYAVSPDAIVIDNVSKRILVYPSGTASDRPDLDASSLPNLLSTYEIHMHPEPITDVTELIHAAAAQDLESVAVFHHPSLQERLSWPTPTPHYSSKILAPHFLLVCARSSHPSEYRLLGATINPS